MLQQIMGEEEESFWLGQDLESGKALELGVPPKDIQMVEVGEQVTWGPAIELVPEGLPALGTLNRGAVGREWCCTGIRG